MNVAQTIETYLEQKRIKKSELAIGIGMPISTLSTKFKRNTFFSEELFAIADFLNLSIASFQAETKDNLLVTIWDKTLNLPNIEKFNDTFFGLSSQIQLYNEDGDGIYIIGAFEEKGEISLLAIEDWSIRTDLVYRIRSLEKIHQFIVIGEFNKIMTEHILFADILKNLLNKRNIKTDVSVYARNMARNWLTETE